MFNVLMFNVFLCNRRKKVCSVIISRYSRMIGRSYAVLMKLGCTLKSLSKGNVLSNTVKLSPALP